MEINVPPPCGVIHLCSHKEQRTVRSLGKISLVRIKPTSSMISVFVWCRSSFRSSPRHCLLFLESFFIWDWRPWGISVPRQHHVRGLVGSITNVPWAPRMTKGEIALGNRILFLFSGHWWLQCLQVHLSVELTTIKRFTQFIYFPVILQD